VSLAARALWVSVTLAILVSFVWCQIQTRLDAIDDFASCAGASYPVMESYPRQCRTPDGRTFVEELGP